MSEEPMGNISQLQADPVGSERVIYVGADIQKTKIPCLPVSVRPVDLDLKAFLMEQNL